MRRFGVTAALVAAVLLPATARAADTRYSLVNGCYTTTGLGLLGAQPVRMQATGLGSYLLYRPDRTFVALVAGAPAVAARPSPAADWTATEAAGGKFTLAAKSDPARRFTVTFKPATGCATYPDAELNATGTPAKGATPYGTARGLLEGHMHWMSYQYFGGQFHCGAPWNAYGITAALPDCASIEGPLGTTATFQNFLNYGNPAQPHDTRGYPYMTSWGAGNLTYEGNYWRWVQRAWMAGLRVMVMGVNENRVLCTLQPRRTESCDEMTTVRRGFKALHELQDYVDAQAGGPGKGFFQIVTNPYDARRVVNSGRMAVIQEIEVSELFGCSNLDHPTCDTASVDRQLDEMYDLGVRSSLLLNKFDNPLSGVRFDAGTTGVLINGGNKVSAGSFFDAETCTGPLHDNTIESGNADTSGFIHQVLTTLGVPGGTTPTYPPAPHCNTRGLTDLGKHVINRMVDKHMIVNPDHMSQAGVDATLSVLESRNYSGVISPHGWMDPGNWPRLWKLGGLAFPGHSDAQTYVDDYHRYRPKATPYKLGWGYGADLGGLSHQPDAAGANITYPFKSYDGSVTFDRERTGQRTFDYNKDGVATYGQYPDWFEDLRQRGGQSMVDDMEAGAEAYLEMWERADGIKPAACHAAGTPFTATGRGDLRLGDDWTALLHRAGQPQERTRAWSWCVTGAANAGRADVAVLSDGGSVQLVGSTAQDAVAGPFRMGAAATFSGTSRQGASVASASAGRITAVGVADATLNGAKLAEALGRVAAAHPSQEAHPTFTGSDAEQAGRIAGRTLAGSTNPQLDRALALYCAMQANVPQN